MPFKAQNSISSSLSLISGIFASNIYSSTICCAVFAKSLSIKRKDAFGADANQIFYRSRSNSKDNSLTLAIRDQFLVKIHQNSCVGRGFIYLLDFFDVTKFARIDKRMVKYLHYFTPAHSLEQ